ncbi:MAG: hypothetical protein DRJ03_14495 [Chloroflexi bacterium]|nr:MAG: hypothetical protein DRJ03_14495 [Chloroflexota bacterium]
MVPSRIERQVKWLVGEFLRNATTYVSIHIEYDKVKNVAEVYLNGDKVATIGERTSIFGWPGLTGEQMVRLSKETLKEEESDG